MGFLKSLHDAVFENKLKQAIHNPDSPLRKATQYSLSRPQLALPSLPIPYHTAQRRISPQYSRSVFLLRTFPLVVPAANRAPMQALLIKSKSGRFAMQCVYMGSSIGVGYWLSIATLQTPEDLVSLPAARCLLTALRIALPCADCCSGRAPESCCCRASSKMGSLRPRTTKKCQRSSQCVIRGAWRKCSKILPSLKVLRSSQEASSEDTLSTLPEPIT